MPKGKKKPSDTQVTRYTYQDIKEPASPETGHTSLLPSDEQIVSLPMDNGWTKAIQVGHLSEDDDRPVIVDMDPIVDPVLMWSGKRSRRDIPVLPLQRNEIVSESRIANIIERARKAAAVGQPQQLSFFADLEKSLREGDKDKRVEFYKHEEGWKNKLICGDSLQVMESLMVYENLRGRVQMIYFDPPYGIDYDSNFQQRVDKRQNNENLGQTDDILTIKAFRDTWSLGIHSYLSYLQERLYLCRELLTETGSIFLQISDEHVHKVRIILDEVFGANNFIREIAFSKTKGRGSQFIDSTYNILLWYAKSKAQATYFQLYQERPKEMTNQWYEWIETDSGDQRLTKEELSGQAPMPAGRQFMSDNLTSQGESENGSIPFTYKGVTYPCPSNRHWRVAPEKLEVLATAGRLFPHGNNLRVKTYADDFGLLDLTDVWNDTSISGFAQDKVYVVQTNIKVVERCILMTTRPGDIVLDPTCGSGSTAYAAEEFGRRWITCDTSRVAINVARKRFLSSIFENYKTRNGTVASGFIYNTVSRISLRSIAYGLEAEKVDLVDKPEQDKSAIRICGPFEIMTLGRYSAEDWKGYVRESGKLENYITVICHLYRKSAASQSASGLIHAIAESDTEKIAISVGPLTGRVSAKQINDAVQDALALGILETHILGWAFEANVGEVKSRLEAQGRVKVQLVMIRPDTLAEGLKVTQPDMLFSPLALPDLEVTFTGQGSDRQALVTLKGVGIFNRKDRSTQYHHAASGYIAAWYLDEDYDSDCFVDSQMFFDFKKAPNLKSIFKTDIDPEEFDLQLTSQPFPVRGYKRIAVKVVDVYGNESTVVKNLE